MNTTIGFRDDEVRTDEPTRSARLKWAIVVAGDLPLGRAVNAAASVSAATAAAIPSLLGPGGADPSGHLHPGLPWVGSTILVADSDALSAIRAKAASRDDTFVADMPVSAQETRVYDEYLERLSSETPQYLAVSIVGPRNAVDRIVGRLKLL